MSQRVESLRNSVGRAGIAAGLIFGLNAVVIQASAQDATTSPTNTSERLLLPTPEVDIEATTTGDTITEADTAKTGIGLPSETPSFEELDSAASDLNEALSGAREKLDELRQATELAAMAAELREELEASIQENNRLAASLAEVQSERSVLETQHNAAQREIVDLTQSVDASKQEIAEQKAKLEQREETIAEIEEIRAGAEEQIRVLEGDLDAAGREVSKLSNEIVDLTGQLEATRTELEDANNKGQQARAERDEADRELSKVRKQIAGMLRSVLLGGEPIDVSALEEADAAAAAEEGEEPPLGLGVRYEAVRASNVRSGPSPDAERVGFAKRGDFITVIGKVSGRNWFEVETVDGVRGFIFGDLIRPAA